MAWYICEIDPVTREPIYNIFQSMRSMWNWQTVVGDDNDMNFCFTNDIYISCRNFERCRNNPYSTSTSAEIVLVCYGQEATLYSCTASYFRPTTRAYSVIGSILQLGNGQYDTDIDVLNTSQSCLAFAILHAVNVITQESSFGVYLPKTHGSISRTTESGHYKYKDVDFDPTPRLWLTGEMDRIVVNTGLAFMAGEKFTQRGTILDKSEPTAGQSGSVWVDITLDNCIPGTDLEGLDIQTTDSESYTVTSRIIIYDNVHHTITVSIPAEIYDHIEVGAEYFINDVVYPVKPAWIPIFGLGSECISSGAYVRLKGTGAASSGLGGLWTL